MGWDEDSPDNSRVLHEEKLGRRPDGYEYSRIVAKHPDGKLYQFEVAYDDEHGITPCKEWPAALTEAVEVEAIETVTLTYRVKQ